MNQFVTSKIKSLSQSYEKLEPKKKKSVLFAVFFGSVLLFSELLLLQPLDKVKAASEESAKLNDQSNSLRKEKADIALEKAYKSEKNLMKQRGDLKKEIEVLLSQGGNKNYLDSVELQKTLEQVIRETKGLNMVSFKNNPTSNVKQDDNESILVKHNFDLVVQGSFQNIFDLLSNVEMLNGINIESINISKNPQGDLLAQINFYVLNTNKHIFTF